MATILTESQQSTLDQMKANLEDVLTKDQLTNESYLLRFLRARDYDLRKSEEMIREEIKWRKDNNIDTLRQNFKKHELLEKYYSMVKLGTTKDGNILWIMRIDKIDFRGMLQCMKYADVCNFWIWLMEESMHYMREETKKQGKPVERQYFIVDFETIELSQIAYKDVILLLRDMAVVLDSYYPETLEKVLIINGNKVFHIMFNLVKPFMHPVTLNKLCIYTAQENWKEVLLNDVDAELIPVHWGGTRTDESGDPTCPNLIPQGGRIPKEHYVTSPFKKLSELDGVETINVGAGSTALVEADITQEGCTLKWIFGTKDNEIAFGLYRKTDQGLEEHCPKEKVDCSVFAEEGEIECRDTGTYVLCFDNSHSLLRSRTVSFRVEVLPPDEEVEKKIREKKERALKAK